MSNDSQNGETPTGLVATTGHPHPGGFPIVGIGASAGGLAAFEAFFGSFPEGQQVGMAFVVVQHLAPDYKSNLAELLQNYTDMDVFEVEDGMPVRPNCVYVIPSNYEMAIMNSTLHLFQLTGPRSQRLPIDFFLSSLAKDQGQLAICLIFSGSGSDGSQGVRAIKNSGGMIMVQSPETTEFESMPRSAINTGVVDFISPVSDMPKQLLAFASRAYVKGPISSRNKSRDIESAIQKLFVMIHARTGHDFSRYKSSTIDRRIERRMAVNQLDSLDAYVLKLQESPSEIDELFRDMLIGVTSFFRDSEAFEKLEQSVLPPMIAEKSKTGMPLRVWVSGCSTGEEAYSIAILVHEQMEALHASGQAFMSLQVFASDIDPRAIASARAGLYPKSIAENLSPTRLARYFTFEAENSAYRIQKKIRDMVVFSEHDINKDPPFSKLDLICCRNLMIYLGGELQRKLIPLFHFALNPNGVLFLGSSEGIGDFEQLFSIIDRKAKLYRRQPDFEDMPRARWQRPSAITLVPTETGQARDVKLVANKPSLRTMIEQAVLSLTSPKAALVDEKGKILYLLGRTGNFLEPAMGEPGVNNIFKMAREGLRYPLATTLKVVVATQRAETVFNLPVKSNGHYKTFNLTVSPVNPDRQPNTYSSGERMYLVLLTESYEADQDKIGNALTAASELPGRMIESVASPDAAALVETLSAQLQAKEEYLQSTLEALETAHEQSKASNEEMQSVNEELHSSNEELETSKEELQSINEELATVNSELQDKVSELSRLNNDMNNLLFGSGIATIFVDTKLRILRFTPTMAQIINLIQSDVGRPVGHIVSNLVGYDRLVVDAQLVLETLESQERRVQTANGLWFHMRIKPYRTLENVIEGVVITFVDITDMKRTEDSLEMANRQLRLAVVVRDASDAITVQDLEGRIIAWNPAATKIYGWSEEEALQLNIRQRVPEALQRECMAQIASLSNCSILEPFRTQRLTKSGEAIDVYIAATSLLNESGFVYAIATTERMEVVP